MGGERLWSSSLAGGQKSDFQASGGKVFLCSFNPSVKNYCLLTSLMSVTGLAHVFRVALVTAIMEPFQTSRELK